MQVAEGAPHLPPRPLGLPSVRSKFHHCSAALLPASCECDEGRRAPSAAAAAPPRCPIGLRLFTESGFGASDTYHGLWRSCSKRRARITHCSMSVQPPLARGGQRWSTLPRRCQSRPRSSHSLSLQPRCSMVPRTDRSGSVKALQPRPTERAGLHRAACASVPGQIANKKERTDGRPSGLGGRWGAPSATCMQALGSGRITVQP